MNGDRITCEIKRLEQGRLTVRTDSMSTVQIEWEDIVRVSSVERFEVELESGEKYIGTLLLSTQDGRLEVAGEEATDSLDLQAVVRLSPMGESFFRRLEGSFDAGYSFTKANDATQWNLAAEVTHRAERLETKVSGSSLITGQEDVDTTSRTELGIQVNRFLGRRWHASLLGQFQQNEELQLKFRSLTGGGIGRQVVQTNTTLVSLLRGVAYSREKFEDLSGNNEAVAVAAVQLQTLSFDFPQTDISDDVLRPAELDGGRPCPPGAEQPISTRSPEGFLLERELLRQLRQRSAPRRRRAKRLRRVISSFGWSF